MLSNPPPLPTAAKDAYAFAAEPKAIQGSPKKKIRESPPDKEQKVAVNIMYDRRIHRGNTYASPALPLHSQPDPFEIQKTQELKRKLKAKKKAEFRRRVKTPDAVQGRKHIDIQTDLYLEELSDKIPEAIAATQTDAFLNRAPSPFFVPQKSGIDVATQVYDGELFDFDFEVVPILEILIAKTVEQSVMEVHEEEELKLLKKHQIKFEEKRNAEMVEVQRLEDAERRRTNEKERRLAEQLRIVKEKQEITEKIAARAFAQSYLNTLVPTIFDNLINNGFFHDKIEAEINKSFLPWLSIEVEKNLDRVKVARKIVDGDFLNLILDIILSSLNNN